MKTEEKHVGESSQAFIPSGTDIPKDREIIGTLQDDEGDDGDEEDDDVVITKDFECG